MRFCNRPYDHFHITHNGKTYSCGWASKRMIGILSEQTVDEIQNGPDVQALRDSIEDQSFRYCRDTSCPYISNDSLPDLSPEDFRKEVDARLGKPPTNFNIAYDYTCNHACPSCRDGLFKTDPGYRDMMARMEEQLLPYLGNAKFLEASGNGDVFSSTYMMNMLSKVKPADKNCLITLETNGVLVKRNWEKVSHLEDYQLTVIVTPNSYERATYQELAGGFDNLDFTMDSLDFLCELRQAGRIKNFIITMVIQQANFREVPAFVETSLTRFKADRVQLRPMLPWFKLFHDKNFALRDLTNPKHPDHAEFVQVMNHPICQDPRVFHWSGKISA
ncbi:SPASM domain-containing protein [Pseudacidovorax sp. RU35E]|uniref:SPASM domain-containing protein n=1 Tax=Pseudacidovorax sp. RU35E TaxID=1907403 RepID=UPI000956A700|nr:SPASM domain-containing protein [Pseudacidovorax sp. RU35E]SIQ14040.1 Iron-sulfur cluster-binding domain-containing protein [Pseudacidovorax sp. RU35E]